MPYSNVKQIEDEAFAVVKYSDCEYFILSDGIYRLFDTEGGKFCRRCGVLKATSPDPKVHETCPIRHYTWREVVAFLIVGDEM